MLCFAVVEVEVSVRQQLPAPACPDILLHPGHASSIDSATISVHNPAGVWHDGDETLGNNRSFNLQAVAKPALEHISSALSRLQRAISRSKSGPSSTISSPQLAWHSKRAILAAVDSSDCLQIFDFSDAIPYLGQTQASFPPPLAPSNAFSHDLQIGAHHSAIAWRPIDGFTVAVGCARGVCLWHLPKPSSLASKPASLVWLQSPGEVLVHSLSWHPKGHLLAASSPHRAGFFVWDVATGSVTSIRAGVESVTMLKFSPCGGYLLAGGKGGSFRLWETSSWKSAKWTLGGSGTGDTGELVGAEWAPDGRALLLVHSHQVTALHLTADHPSLTAQVLPVPLQELAEATGSSVESVAWDPRGQRLAVALTSNSSGSSPAMMTKLAMYDARCSPILTARFIGFANVGPLGGGSARDNEPEWEIVEAEEEIRVTNGAGAESGDRAALAFMPGFGQGAVLSVRKGEFIGTVPMYFSILSSRQLRFQVAAQRPTLDTEVARLDAALDDELSKRPLDLDAAGYFIIKLDSEQNEIVAEYFTNIINKNGLACDPETGEVIPCTPGYVRPPSRVYKGRTAKEISVKILEQETGAPACTHLEHANYLGREFQRAEFALITGQDYIQD